MRGHSSTLTPKPLDIFIVAEQFRATAKFATLVPLLSANNPGWFDVARGEYLPLPSIVCSAFALELYFKCLMRIGRKPYWIGHDLCELFSMIGRRERAKIKRLWSLNSARVIEDVEASYIEDGRPSPKITFEFCLSASKDAFTLMRYIFETGMAPDKGWLADTIIECARRAILDKHSEWESARQKSPFIKTSFQSTFQAH